MPNSASPETLFREVEGKAHKRVFTLERGKVDEETRTVNLAFSSSEPCERGYYEKWIEVLDHSPGSMRLDRLRDGSPLLKDHDMGIQIGVIEGSTVETGADEINRTDVRFSKRQVAEDEYQDVLDDIRTKVSVGYIVHKMVLEEERDDGPNVYRVTDWEPYEISLVSVALDHKKAGVGRSMEEEQPPPEIPEDTEEREMPDLKTDENVTEVAVNSAREDARKEERERVDEIVSIGNARNMQEMAAKAVREGTSTSDFKTMVISSMETVRSEDPGSVDMEDKDKQAYSPSRAIEAFIDKDWRGAGLEFEVHRTLESQMGKKARGVYIPNDRQIRTIAASGTGSNIIGTDHRSELFVDVLRNKSVCAAMGAEFLPGLVADQAIPRMPSGASFSWIDNEATDGAESTPIMAGVNLTPKTVVGGIGWTRKMDKQSSPVVDAMMDRHLSGGVAEAIDIAAINGAGGVSPLGILGTTGIGIVAGGANGAAMANGHVIDLETLVANNNADLGKLGYCANSRVRGALKQTEKASGTAQFIWNGAELNGYRAHATNAVPSNLTKGTGTGLSACIYGNWADLYVGLFGALDVKPDEITNIKRGGIVLWVFQDVDIRVIRPESFAAMVDIITQ